MIYCSYFLKCIWIKMHDLDFSHIFQPNISSFNSTSKDIEFSGTDGSYGGLAGTPPDDAEFVITFQDMSAQTISIKEKIQPLPKYTSILLAVDSSDHSNRATHEAMAMASNYGSTLAAAHVYAAQLKAFLQPLNVNPIKMAEDQVYPV